MFWTKSSNFALPFELLGGGGKNIFRPTPHTFISVYAQNSKHLYIWLFWMFDGLFVS